MAGEAAHAFSHFIIAMAGREKDIDPQSLLVEDDEESALDSALPETEDSALDLEAASGPLAAGRDTLLRYAKLAPSAPGVYRMMDAAGEVLYVGKAKSIKKRFLSYTRPTGHDTRIERVIANTASVEFVTTATETEALLLEANLIKRLRPRFNVLLRDDKSFPYILISGDHWAPQILKHRGARSRRGQYYGPFASVWAVNRTITALQRAFLLRNCSDGFFESRTRPCLLHQIKRCSGPCTQEIDFAGYANLVREANAFLSGKSQAVKQELAGAMEKASVELDFERAAIYRDRLAALSAVQGTQGINPRSTEEATCSPSIRTAASTASRCSSSAPGRTGATAPTSRARTARSSRARCWARSSRSSMTTSRPPRRSCCRTTFRSASCWPRR
jgi:excinuclease ABC subunit C